MAWRHPPYFREQGGAGKAILLSRVRARKIKETRCVLAASGETFETIEEQRAAKPAAAA